MRFRGLALSGSLVEFNVADAPVVITEGEVALFGNDNCKEILRLKTITRGERFFEGDKVVDAVTGQLYGYVRYNKGFCMQMVDGGLKEIPEELHIKVVTGDRKSILAVTQSDGWEPVSMVYRSETGEEAIIGLLDIITKVGGCLAIDGGSRLVECSRVGIPTGYVDARNGRRICFGDEYAGGVVVLDGNTVSIHAGDTVQKLADCL